MNFSLKIIVGCVLAVFFGVVFSSLVSAEKPISPARMEWTEPVGFDLLPTGQMRFFYDLNGDGKADYGRTHTVVGFIGYPRPCADHDPRYLLVPRDGAYIIDARPVSSDTAPNERAEK